MSRASALFERLAASDSFGLLPSPAERIFAPVALPAVDVPFWEGAELAGVEACS